MAKVTVLNNFVLLQGKVLVSLIIIGSSLLAVSETSLCTNCTASRTCCFDVCIEEANCLGQYCLYDEHCSEGEICCSSKCVDRYNPIGCPCQNDHQCSTGQHCCNFECVNAPNCLGKQCENTMECSNGERCCANTCVRGPSCVGLSCNIGYPKCSHGENCCNNKCVNGSHCLEQSCEKNSDCGSSEQCCNGKCVSYVCERFSGITCRADDNCAFSATKKYCCDGTCSNDSYCFTAQKKTVTIFTTIAFCIFIAVVIVAFIFRHRKRRIRRAGQTQVSTANEAQAYQNYQAPPPYQPEESYYPLPEYEEDESEMSTSYFPAMTREDEPPPPYSAEEQGESGGQLHASEAT